MKLQYIVPIRQSYMKIVLFGAGSAQFGFGMVGDIFQSHVLHGAEIVLVDIDGQKLDRVYKHTVDFVENQGLDFKVIATTDREKALRGADYVIISIEVGDRFELWDMDWKTPLQFGVPQIYGENGGPGGIFHALRITPPILEIVEDITKLCPNAVVFNFSNPMTAITTAVLRRYPEISFTGICHEITSLARYLPAVLNTPPENLHCRAAGLNHFSVLLEATYSDTGRDAYPDILKTAPSFFEKEPGYSEVWEYVKRTGEVPRTEGATERWAIDRDSSTRPWSDRTLFKAILETYHLLPITVDSHLGEYIAWAQDIADHRGIQDFYEFYRFKLSKWDDVEIRLELSEHVVPIIEGIEKDSGYEEAAVNIMNDGFIPEFPSNIAVEVPATIDKDGIHGVGFPRYPKGFGALIRNYAGTYDLTAEAILTGKKDYVIQAVLASPMATKYRNVRDMVDSMLSQQQRWTDYIH